MASDITQPISLWQRPTMPTAERELQVLRILRYAGRTDIRDYPPGFRLAARISDLKAHGWPITTRMITLPGGTRVAEYRL